MLTKDSSVSKLTLAGSLVIAVLGPDGKIIDLEEVHNLITDIGDQYFAERASNIASPPAQVTGMQLGSGATAAAKTGGGAAIGAYIAGSSVAIDATYPQSSQPGGAGTARRITWRCTWAAGVATNGAITEVAIVNQSIATDAGAPAANTISRATFAAKAKGAADSMVITWNHDLLGA